MNEPICVFTDEKTAERAEQLVEAEGVIAKVAREKKDRHADRKKDLLYVLTADRSDRKAVLDAVSKLADSDPGFNTALVHCPSCGSVAVQFPNIPYAWPGARAMGRAVDAIADTLHFGHHDFLCSHCEHTWAAEPVHEKH